MRHMLVCRCSTTIAPGLFIVFRLPCSSTLQSRLHNKACPHTGQLRTPNACRRTQIGRAITVQNGAGIAHPKAFVNIVILLPALTRMSVFASMVQRPLWYVSLQLVWIQRREYWCGSESLRPPFADTMLSPSTSERTVTIKGKHIEVKTHKKHY